MVCGSKISCVAWSAFHQSTLASSDYDHTVIVWDAATATKVCFFNYFYSFCKNSWDFIILSIFLLVTVWPQPIWKKVRSSWQMPPQHQSTYPGGAESASIEIPLSDLNLLSKSTSKCKHCETRFTLQFLKILWSEVWKGGFQLMLILGLLGMYFDAAVVFVTKS